MRDAFRPLDQGLDGVGVEAGKELFQQRRELTEIATYWS